MRDDARPVPVDLEAIADPRLIISAWAAGLAIVAGAIWVSRIVRPGFVWLAGGTASFLGLIAALTEGAWWARAGVVMALAGLAMARWRRIAGTLLTLGGIAMTAQVAEAGGWLPATSGVLALGGVTGEMLLGHWYLVDPRLPRTALRALALIGIGGLAAEGLMLARAGLPDGDATVAFWVLLSTSIVLMLAVIGALRYPAYSGVMAATGLSYLAVLTTLGAVFLGRALVAGLGPFTT